MGAVDYWLDILQKQSLHSRRDYGQYKTFEDVRAYMKQVEKRTHNYLDSLTPKRLDKPYKVKDDDITFEVTAEDILIHVFEEVHHRGELIALLWQMNVEPPPMGWKGL